MKAPRGDYRGDNPDIVPDSEEDKLLDQISDAFGAQEEAEWLASLTPEERALYERLLRKYEAEARGDPSDGE